MGRAPCCEKVGLKKGRWTAEEDEILAKYIQANGEGSWRSLPKNAGLLRCGKSCRLRWINYLRADLKRGNISAEEEDTIVKLHASFGNRWSLIASHLPGRTDNEIKNYWNSHLSRKIYRFQRVSNSEPGVMDIPPPQRRGGRTSRWAMRKNKTYTAQKDTEIRPKQRVVSTQQQMNSEAVPVPQTPSLESEGLSHAVADLMLLEAEGVKEVDEARKEEEEEEEEEVEVKRTHEKTCVDGEKETSEDDILGLFYEVEGGSINGGGEALCFSDIMMMESFLVEQACGVSELSEERELGNDVVGVGEENERTGRKNIDDACLNYNCKMASSSEDPDSSVNLSSNGESGEWYCSPNWDWESVMEFDHDLNIIDPDGREYKENLLTWLWQDDDWESDPKKLGEIDPQRQKDMIAWFLS